MHACLCTYVCAEAIIIIVLPDIQFEGDRLSLRSPLTSYLRKQSYGGEKPGPHNSIAIVIDFILVNFSKFHLSGRLVAYAYTKGIKHLHTCTAIETTDLPIKAKPVKKNYKQICLQRH